MMMRKMFREAIHGEAPVWDIDSLIDIANDPAPRGVDRLGVKYGKEPFFQELK